MRCLCSILQSISCFPLNSIINKPVKKLPATQDHLFGKHGDVRELTTSQRNVRQKSFLGRIFIANFTSEDDMPVFSSFVCACYLQCAVKYDMSNCSLGRSAVKSQEYHSTWRVVTPAIVSFHEI